jgi:predicted CXXCH cytochrome family protein
MKSFEKRKETGGEMKRTLQASLVAALGLVLASAAYGYTGTYTPGAGINLTPHDLAQSGNGMSGYNANPTDIHARICIFCHAPHNAYKLSPANGGPAIGVGGGPTAPDAYDYLPLWNHTLPAPTVYTMYWSGPGQPQTGPTAQQTLNNQVVGSGSLLCLSCHDGSVAVNSYGNGSQPTTSQSTGTATIGPGYVIGKDGILQNHHPVGFSYGMVFTGEAGGGVGGTGGIRPTTETMGTAGTIASHLYASQALGVNDAVECGTCHSVHNTGNTGETLLWRSDTSSRLCLTCHNKGNDPGATIP